MGKPLRYEYVTPYEFGLVAHAALVYDERDVPKKAYAAFFDSLCSFNNDSPHQPFKGDTTSVLREIPISRVNSPDSPCAPGSSRGPTQRTLGQAEVA